MNLWLLPCVALIAASAAPLGAGDYTRCLKVGELTRQYLVHIPRTYVCTKPAPVVIAYHGASMDAEMMADFTGLNDKADEAGFIVVYPTGTGVGNLVLTWNAGGLGQCGADDVAFTAELLDDLARVLRIDRKRVYATGMSNGAMMAYRVAAKLPGRIAAIAPVAGTMTLGDGAPACPVPILHFHGTADPLVPFAGPNKNLAMLIKFVSVAESMKAWAKWNGCPEQPRKADVRSGADGDDLEVRRESYGPGKNTAEVILYVIEGGGHAWPGRPNPFPWLGKTTYSISANDLMWDFFLKHPRK